MPKPLDDVLSRLSKVRRTGSGYLACCPSHRDRDPSLSVSVGANGKLLLHCHAGCSFKDVLAAIDMPPDRLDFEQPLIVPSEADEIQKAEKLFNEGRFLHPDDPVCRYLSGRGIVFKEPPLDLRHHPSLDYWQQRDGRPYSIGKFDAMLGAVRDKDGSFRAVHITYLASSGHKLSSTGVIDSDRKIRGRPKGGAIRLFTPASALIVGEGIETCLSASAICGLPSWSCVSQSGLRSVELPDQVSTVFICVDDDEAGIEASLVLSDRLSKDKKVFFLPAGSVAGSKDWNDVIKVITNNASK